MTATVSTMVKAFKLHLRNGVSEQEKRHTMVDPLSLTTRTYFLQILERLTNAARNNALTPEGHEELTISSWTMVNLMLFDKRTTMWAVPTTSVAVQCLLLSAPNVTADAEVQCSLPARAANTASGGLRGVDIYVDAHFDTLIQKRGWCKESLATPIGRRSSRMRNLSYTA